MSLYQIEGHHKHHCTILIEVPFSKLGLNEDQSFYLFIYLFSLKKMRIGTCPCKTMLMFSGGFQGVSLWFVIILVYCYMVATVF